MKKDDYFKNIIDNLAEAVYICDWDRKISYWNKAAEKMTGFTAEEVTGSHCWQNILVHTDIKGRSLCTSNLCPAIKAMKEERLLEEEIYLKHKKGHRVPVSVRVSPIKDETGKVTGAIEIFSDTSAKINAFKKIEKLEKLAFIDSLTGVGNRRYTEIKINAKLEEMERYAWVGNFGLLFMDIDHFKKINDTKGHDVGDKVLTMVAKTIMGNLREEDFIGRWGGEEFIVIVSNMNRKSLYFIAEKLRSLVEQSGLDVDGETVKATVSVGAVLAERGNTMAEVISRADSYMYESKNSGRNFVTIG